MKPEMSTKYTFRCTAPLGFGEQYADGLVEDSAIADSEAKARKIILDCYGHNLDRFVVLVSKTPILLYDPAPNFVEPFSYLVRKVGPREDS
jgi:hypothetical protein